MEPSVGPAVGASFAVRVEGLDSWPLIVNIKSENMITFTGNILKSIKSFGWFNSKKCTDLIYTLQI